MQRSGVENLVRIGEKYAKRVGEIVGGESRDDVMERIMLLEFSDFSTCCGC